MKTGCTFKLFLFLFSFGLILLKSSSPAAAQSCTDSDGLDPFQKGSVQTSNETVSDYCIADNTVVEFYCDNVTRRSLNAGCGAEVDTTLPNEPRVLNKNIVA